MVPVTGLEPVRHRWRWILSPLRLPFHHTGRCYGIIHYLFQNSKGKVLKNGSRLFSAVFFRICIGTVPGIGFFALANMDFIICMEPPVDTAYGSYQGPGECEHKN